MGIKDIFKRNKQEQRSVGTTSICGRYTNEGFICTISAVFNAISLITNSIAELPITVRIEDKTNPTHPFINLFRNGMMNKFNFMKQIAYDIIMHGNGYALIKRDKNGVPSSLTYLQAPLVNHMYIDQSLEHYYLVNQYGIGRVEPDNMLHFFINSQNGVHGKPITMYGKKVFDLCKYTDSAAADYFSSGMNLSGILTIQGNPNQQEINNIRENWRMMHGADGIKSSLAILKGNMTYNTVGNNAIDSQLLESRLYNVNEVARVFNMSPVMLGDLSKSSYNTLEQVFLEFLQHTMLPYISMIEEELNRKLCKDSDIIIDLDETYLLRTDKNAQANYLQKLVSSGICSVNEARKTLNLAPKDGADDLFVAYSNPAENQVGGTNEKDVDKPE